MGTFVEVPATAIRERLVSLGFKQVVGVRGREEVFERAHHKDARYTVRVYTTIPTGAGVARACGADAIRIVALFTPAQGADPRGVYKATRTFRTGTVEGVLDRMQERLREAYGFINERYGTRRRAS